MEQIKKGTSQARKAKIKEFKLISDFPLGYRNREDKTNLPPGVLIEGSQNVLTDVTGRVGITKGYVLDGPPEVVTTGYLLQEDGFYLLLETGGRIILT